MHASTTVMAAVIAGVTTGSVVAALWGFGKQWMGYGNGKFKEKWQQKGDPPAVGNWQVLLKDAEQKVKEAEKKAMAAQQREKNLRKEFDEVCEAAAKKLNAESDRVKNAERKAMEAEEKALNAMKAEQKATEAEQKATESQQKAESERDELDGKAKAARKRAGCAELRLHLLQAEVQKEPSLYFSFRRF